MTFITTIRLIRYAGSLADLSAIYCRLRDATQEGAITFASVLVYESGKCLPAGYIAYNGRIFEGRPQEWTAATKLLYDNRSISDVLVERPDGTVEKLVFVTAAEARAEFDRLQTIVERGQRFKGRKIESLSWSGAN